MFPPLPQRTLVVQYGYDWGGNEKSRPCLIVDIEKGKGNDPTTVTVLPISTKEEANQDKAVEIPPQVAQQLGLPKQSWLNLSHANKFQWPFDVERVKLGPKRDQASFGHMGTGFYKSAVQQFAANRQKAQVQTVDREKTDLSNPEYRKGRPSELRVSRARQYAEAAKTRRQGRGAEKDNEPER